MWKQILEKFLKIDRRYIFVLLAISLFIPIMKPLNLPNSAIGIDVRNVYEKIESLPEGSFVLLSLDYDPATRPELHPQAIAVIRHCFRKNIKMAVITFIAGSTGLIEEIFATIPKEFNKVYGKDYVILPYMPNYFAVITQMGSDLYAIYNKDKEGNDLAEIPVMKGIKNYKDMNLAMCFTGTALLDAWVAYVGDKFDVQVLGGVTAVSQPGYAPYLQTGQLKGLIGGMKGAADYETLINQAGKGTSGIDALNLGHFLVLILILLSNCILVIIKHF